MKWQKGRQKATESLRKLTLWRFLCTDGYILNIPSDTVIDWHFDKCAGKRHFRFNLTLKGFWIFVRRGKGAIGNKLFNWHIFRPDNEEHMAVIKRNTYILSIGFAI